VSLKGYLESQYYEADVEFTIRKDDDAASGFGLFFFLRQPRDYPSKRKGIYGVSNENGVGVFVHRKGPDQWIVAV